MRVQSLFHGYKYRFFLLQTMQRQTSSASLSMASSSPSDAMNAYTHTLHLRKYFYDEEGESVKAHRTRLHREYISALPAGKRTQLMVDDGPSGGISPSTLALAAAAHQTCGKVICVRHEQADVEVARRHIETLNLTGVIELRLGRSLQVVEQVRNVDFAVVDHRMECWKFFTTVDANPCGGIGRFKRLR